MLNNSSLDESIYLTILCENNVFIIIGALNVNF